MHFFSSQQSKIMIAIVPCT